MAFLLEHTRFGFCWLDLPAVLLLVVLFVVYLIRRHDLKVQKKELEDKLSALYAGDLTEDQNTAIQE